MDWRRLLMIKPSPSWYLDLFWGSDIRIVMVPEATDQQCGALLENNGYVCECARGRVSLLNRYRTTTLYT